MNADHTLTTLFAPSSVSIVGASGDTARLSPLPFRGLARRALRRGLSGRTVVRSAVPDLLACPSILRILSVLLAAAALFGTLSVHAQSYPTQPVRMVVGFPPGGTTDVIARLLGQKLTSRLGRPVVVENRPGASGIIGADAVAKSAPDGYSLMLTSSTLGTNLNLYSKLPYDTVKDFTPVSLVATTPYMLVVHPSLPVHTVKELIAYLKQRPGVFNMSAGALGTAQHLGAELFKRVAGVDVLLVPYKGSGSVLPDMVAGRLSLAFENEAIIGRYAQSGALRALAITSAERSVAFPEIPTMMEAGVKDFQLIGWFGVYGPAHMSADIVQKLNTEITAVLQEPEMRERLAAMGATPRGGPPADLRDLLAREVDVWGKVIRDAAIHLE
jgi:tripartite-type tricarboxylate transporter receptor subunit TctC